MAQSHGTSTIRDNFYLDEGRWAQGRNTLLFLALAGWLACAAGFALDRPQFFKSYLVAFAFGITIALGAFFFVMVQYLTGSAWSVSLRRSMENLMMTIPAFALMFIPIAFGLHDLYHWTHKEVVAKDALLQAKSGFLNEQFFLIRAAAYFALWSVWAWMLHRNSLKYDQERSVRRMNIAAGWSAPGLFLAIVVGTLAAFDWIMSLDPHWYSTMFGLYCLAGGGVAFMAVLTLIALGFRRAGILQHSITNEHLHDLGKWMFALSCFYTYIGFCQYLLIWYANIPEETIWYKHRFEGTWIYGAIALVVGRFFVPFFLLAPRANKRKPALLNFVAIWIIAIHYIDMYWVMMPVWFPHGFHLHWLDAATLIAVMSTAGLMFWRQLRGNALVNVGDVRFEQGLRLENA